MKKLVLGALLAVASVSVGCSASTGDDGGGGGGSTSAVTVHWDFVHFASNAVRSCPTGYGTAAVTSQTTSDTTHLGTGATIVDLFDCSAGTGTIDLPDNDTYLTWVDITSDSGGAHYAQTDEVYVDTLASVAPITYKIYDDAGYFFFEWDLVDAQTRAPLSCTAAALDGSSAAIESSATVVGNASILFTDKFTCADHYGTTDPLIAGNYTVSVQATKSDAAVGDANVLTNKQITAPNGLTDLGLVLIPVD